MLQQVRAQNPKFHPGPDPIERELKIPVIMPTDKQQLDVMTKMLEKEFGESHDPQKKQALELWKIQVAQGTISDQVKLQFLRRFFFWLLGRGDEEDHKKTLWGRANAAVYNKEVASYIDMFVDKRTEYVQKLLSLANNVPDTLYGYYLYFKYIVNGGLQQKKAKDGTINYDFSDEDYLQDFDIFQQVFDSKETTDGVQYFKLAGGLKQADESKNGMFGKAGVPGPINNQTLQTDMPLVRDTSISTRALQEEDEQVLNNSLNKGDKSSLNQSRQPFLSARWSSAGMNKRDSGNVVQDPAEPNAISSGSGMGSVAVNEEAMAGGNDVTVAENTEVYQAAYLEALDQIEELMEQPDSDEKKRRLKELLGVLYEAREELKARRSSVGTPTTPQRSGDKPRTPASMTPPSTIGPRKSTVPSLDTPAKDKEEASEEHPKDEGGAPSKAASAPPKLESPPQTPVQSRGVATERLSELRRALADEEEKAKGLSPQPSPPGERNPMLERRESSMERSLQRDLQRQFDMSLERAVAQRKVAKLAMTMAEAETDRDRKMAQLALAKEALERSFESSEQANRIRVDPAFIGHSPNVSLSSTVNDSSVSSADIVAKVEAEERAAEAEAEDIDENAMEGSSANETDKSLSDLINNVESEVSSLTSEEEAASLPEESSTTVTLASDEPSQQSQTHESMEVGGDKGKVVKRHGYVYVPLSGRQEVADRTMFHLRNPTLAPAEGRHEKPSAEHPYGRWVTKELIGYKPLNEFAKDKTVWTNDQKVKLRRAIFNAFHTLRGEWGDLSNPTNVAIRYDESNDSFDVKFYEGGRWKGERTVLTEFDTINKMADLLRNVRKSLVDKEWNRIYKDLR